MTTYQQPLQDQAQELDRTWQTQTRWRGVSRNYDAADVVRLRGSKRIEYTLAHDGAEKLWRLLHDEPFVNALGALVISLLGYSYLKAAGSKSFLERWINAFVMGNPRLFGKVSDEPQIKE